MSTVAYMSEYRAKKQVEHEASATLEDLMIESNGLKERHMKTLDNLAKLFTRTVSSVDVVDKSTE